MSAPPVERPCRCYAPPPAEANTLRTRHCRATGLPKDSSRPLVRGVRRKYPDPEYPPASTLAGVAALVLPDWLIEVEAVADVG